MKLFSVFFRVFAAMVGFGADSPGLDLSQAGHLAGAGE